MNIGVGIGLIVAICGAIMIGFMIAIDRYIVNGKETKGAGPNIGDVEIIEADGYYAVRQFAWYDYDYNGAHWLERISYVKTYYRYEPDWGSSSLKWLYVDQNRFVSVEPEPVTLEFARNMAEELRTKFSDYVRRRKYLEDYERERQVATDALRNGKVIG